MRIWIRTETGLHVTDEYDGPLGDDFDHARSSHCNECLNVCDGKFAL